VSACVTATVTERERPWPRAWLTACTTPCVAGETIAFETTLVIVPIMKAPISAGMSSLISTVSGLTRNFSRPLTMPSPSACTRGEGRRRGITTWRHVARRGVEARGGASLGGEGEEGEGRKHLHEHHHVQSVEERVELRAAAGGRLGAEHRILERSEVGDGRRALAHLAVLVRPQPVLVRPKVAALEDALALVVAPVPRGGQRPGHNDG